MYARDSGGSEQDASTDQQEQAARAWCTTHNYILSKVFVDAARPGSTTAGRDGFEQMIQYLRGGGEGEAGVIVWKFSRMARNLTDAQFYRADLRRRGYEIYSLNDVIPPGPEGRLIETVVDFMNERYLADLSSDVARGQKYLAVIHHGYPLGRTPIGLRRVPFEIGKHRDGKPHIVSRLEPDPLTAPLVLQAFEMRSIGATYREIDEQVHLFGSKPSYSKILRHSLYIGRFTYQDLTIDDFCKPIIPLALWHAVQRINQDWVERRIHPRQVASRFLLSGLLTCGLCGHPMTGRTVHAPKWPTSRFDYYRCTRSSELARCPARLIPKAAIETRVIGRLAETLQRRDVLEAVYLEAVEIAHAASTETDPALARARADLSRLDGEIRNILAAIKESGHSGALLGELSSLEKRQGELRAQVASLESKRQSSRVISFDQAAAQWAVLAERLRATGDRELQQLLRALVVQIAAARVGDGVKGEIAFGVMGREIRLEL